ncbi:hypothetical protein [Leeuwenhoekiella aequorea]|uniref:Lipocalin-like protein n=1 Tax=Leeuwenhoekiella aequorea TaxID=283736 RepID=A0A4Q0P9I1_9FLAO|nr:hypothetical protein [Leeuwenhoekiella aequorea]RXG23383.1 hypothetical protein DSM00_997 [Leeuwenhoekiella aequorea]
MKLQILSIATFIAFMALPFVQVNETPVETSIQGTWELKDFYYYDDNKIIDTVGATDGYRQIKMYTNDRVMWTRYVPKDSVEWFGYGKYSVSNDQLIETLEYGSESMMEVIDTLRIFTFELEYTDNSYSQISTDAEGNRIFSENYIRIE